MTLHPDKMPLIHGLVDGELDAVNTLAIETHLKGCGDCRAELDRIQEVRDLISGAQLRERAPDALRRRIEDMLEAEAGASPAASGPVSVQTPHRGIGAAIFSARWASGALAGALAASMALLVAVPRLTTSGVEDQMVQSHVRSLLVQHVVDIPTSDRHVVKPWFNGKIDFAPAVPELKEQGFPLVGGRLDYIDDHEVAAIVYRRRLHTINLFVRPTKALSSPVAYSARKDGYSIQRWTDGGLEYWAVSDIDPGDLALFRQAYEAQAKT